MLDGSLIWIALPVGILILIAALWFLVIAPAGSAPPREILTPASAPTAWPTVTPMLIEVPTQAPAESPTIAPAQPSTVSVGARVEVVDTGANMLRVRQLPGTSTVTVQIVPDGTKLVIIGGPEEADGYTWWKVDDQAGTVGWAAGQFLKLAP
jgi:hypothetical protein